MALRSDRALVNFDADRWVPQRSEAGALFGLSDPRFRIAFSPDCSSLEFAELWRWGDREQALKLLHPVVVIIGVEDGELPHERYEEHVYVCLGRAGRRDTPLEQQHVA